MDAEKPIMIDNIEITKGMIENAERILVDNGIDRDDACVVLQAIGYAILDTELYPEDV